MWDSWEGAGEVGGFLRREPIQRACVTLGGVQVYLHCGVAPGVQDFSGKDFLHGHDCTTRDMSEQEWTADPLKN